MDKLTLITAYFDQTIDLNLTKNILVQPVNLVIFTKSEFTSAIWQQRKELSLLHKTCIIPYKLEQSNYYKYLNFINKDNSLAILLNWIKLDLIKYVCQYNPFDSSHLAWINIELANVADFSYINSDDIFNYIVTNIDNDKIKMLMIRYFTASDMDVGNVSSDFITANINSFIKFVNFVDLELTTLLTPGFNSEKIMTKAVIKVISRNLDLFTFYYGNYRSTLSNYRHLKQDFDTINNNLIYCRDKSEHIRATDIGRSVLRDYQSAHFKITGVEYSSFLLNYYICAYYVDGARQSAKRLFGLYVRFINNNKNAKRFYLSNKAHIDNNFNYINDKVDNYRLCKDFEFDDNVSKNTTGAADCIGVNFTSNIDSVFNPMNWTIFTAKPNDPYIDYNNGDKYFALVRAINYTVTWQDHQYNISKPTDSTEADDTLFSKMLLFKINNNNGKYNFSFINEIKDLSRTICTSKYHGWEDCRVIRANKEIWISGIVSDSEINGNPRICLGQLDLAKLAIVKSYALERKLGSIMEKNWLPYQINNNIISFVYSYQPFILANVDLNQAKALDNSSLHNYLTPVQFTTINQDIDLSNLEGSAAPIDYKDGKLILTHFSYKFENRYYYRFVILFTNNEFKVLTKTLPFYFEFEGIEFSLSWILQNDKLLITSSSLDNYPKLVVLSLTELDTMLF